MEHFESMQMDIHYHGFGAATGLSEHANYDALPLVGGFLDIPDKGMAFWEWDWEQDVLV